MYRYILVSNGHNGGVDLVRDSLSGIAGVFEEPIQWRQVLRIEASDRVNAPPIVEQLEWSDDTQTFNEDHWRIVIRNEELF